MSLQPQAHMWRLWTGRPRLRDAQMHGFAPLPPPSPPRSGAGASEFPRPGPAPPRRPGAVGGWVGEAEPGLGGAPSSSSRAPRLGEAQNFPAGTRAPRRGLPGKVFSREEAEGARVAAGRRGAGQGGSLGTSARPGRGAEAASRGRGAGKPLPPVAASQPLTSGVFLKVNNKPRGCGGGGGQELRRRPPEGGRRGRGGGCRVREARPGEAAVRGPPALHARPGASAPPPGSTARPPARPPAR